MLERLMALSKEVTRNGRPASDDPVIRQKLAQMYTEIEIFRLNQMRTLTRMSKSGVPGPEGVVLALGAVGEARQAFVLADAAHALFAAGENLMDINLVADVPDDLVLRRIEETVQNN